jgi:hypothetical protein
MHSSDRGMFNHSNLIPILRVFNTGMLVCYQHSNMLCLTKSVQVSGQEKPQERHVHFWYPAAVSHFDYLD